MGSWTFQLLKVSKDMLSQCFGSVCDAAATADSEEVPLYPVRLSPVRDLQLFLDCHRTPSHSLAFDFITNCEADQQVLVSLKVP